MKIFYILEVNMFYRKRGLLRIIFETRTDEGNYVENKKGDYFSYVNPYFTFFYFRQSLYSVLDMQEGK